MAISVQKSAVIQGGTSQDIILDVVNGTPIKDLKQIDMKIGASDAAPVKLGSAGTAQLAVSAEATASLIPIGSGDSGDASKQQKLAEAGMADFFSGSKNADEVLLLLDLGAKADASAKLPVKYQAVSGEITLAAGVDAGYVYARSFRDTTTIDDAALDFFGNIALPSTLNRPLHEDEHLVFDFGGYAQFGASVSAGWQLAGSQALNVGKLTAAEKYAFSIIGKVGVSAKIAGRFRIAVQPSPDKANWARVTVAKNDQRELGIAADIIAGANFSPQGFPSSAKEFLEAAIGTRAKSWIAYFDAAENWTNPATAKQKLDTLAQSFIEKWSDKVFEQLDAAGLGKALDELQKAIDSYNTLGDRAVALFDRYYDPIADKLEKRVADALESLTKVSDWDELKNRVLDNDLFEVLDTLSGGRIAEILNSGEAKAKAELQAIQDKAKAILDAVDNKAHAEIKKLIANAKTAFGLDPLVARLEKIGTLEQIQASADKQAIGFAERLIDQALTEIQNSQIGKFAAKLNETLNAIETFAQTWYAKFTAALAQSFSFQVHAEYNKSSNRDAMLSFDVDLTSDGGRRVLHQTVKGDFGAPFDADAAVVAILQGTFSRKLASQRAISINVVGWNKRPWKFDSVRDLIVESTQTLVPGPNGLTVTTDAKLTASNEVRRNNEQLMSNFILRFAGQTQAADGKKFDGQDFLIDSLRSVGATYTLAITDDNTTKDELAGYLALADSLGFLPANVPDPIGAIIRMVPNTNGNYGKVQLDYDIQFTPEGIAAALKTNPTERQIRFIARLIVLTNALDKPVEFKERAWAYWSDATFTNWQQKGPAWVNLTTGSFPVKTSPISSVPRPFESVSLERTQRIYLNTLYNAENSMIQAIGKLSAIQAPITNADLTNTLNDVANDIGSFDRFDNGDNTWFAIFDQLVSLANVPDSRSATLKIIATQAGKDPITIGLIS